MEPFREQPQIGRAHNPYDFDGTKNGFDRDTFCTLFSVCSAQLANSSETHLGGGDSGGPSFMRDAVRGPARWDCSNWPC